MAPTPALPERSVALMSRQVLNTALTNLVLLVLVAMPLFFLLVWIQSLLGQVAGATDVGYVIETGGVYYLTNLLPVLVGGLVHQAVWLALPGEWLKIVRRIVALLFTPLIPIVVLLSWGGPAESLAALSVPMVLALAVYVFLMRSPAAPCDQV